MYDTYEALREEENEKGTTYSMHGLLFTADTERTCKLLPFSPPSLPSPSSVKTEEETLEELSSRVASRMTSKGTSRVTSRAPTAMDVLSTIASVEAEGSATLAGPNCHHSFFWSMCMFTSIFLSQAQSSMPVC